MRAFLQEYPFVRPSQAYAVFRALAHVKEGIEWARPKVLDGQGGLCMIQAEKFDTATFETCTTELILPVSPQQELSVSDVCTGGRKLIAMVDTDGGIVFVESEAVAMDAIDEHAKK
eukprot:GEMP01084082.1.p1 GENE.GEMP01084082.1~~GEMP01084082.1.p1  ORF type:complete len:116 (+),score=42.53 GEMP01084082.1:536-883(+)